MNSTIRYIVDLDPTSLKNPILIQGLPGVGNVGKLSVTHMIKELNAIQFAELYSYTFPYHVLVDDKGILRLLRNEFWYAKIDGKNDIILLTGDYQSQTPDGQYEIVNLILDLAEKFQINQIFTLGGYATGSVSKNPRVFGTATNPSLIEHLKDENIEINESGGPIVGASGLLIGLGKMRGIEGACLLGETSGFMADALSAKVVLEKLVKLVKIELDLDALEKKALKIEEVINQMKKMKRHGSRGGPDIESEEEKDDLSYIG
ncbi:MAG: proteasome assembly chaperone family protein [Promethearchaeota archaeon]